MFNSAPLHLVAARALLRLAIALGVVVVAVQLLNFANQPSLAPATFAVALSAGMFALARSSTHLFEHRREARRL